MSAKVTVTGNLGQDPQIRYTPSGRAVLDLSIAATHRAKNKQTDQWEDRGEPLWLRASFWGDQAETLAQSLAKGDKVTVEGALVIEKYSGRNGDGIAYILDFPRFLGVIPKAGQQSSPQASYAAPTSDPWGAPAETPLVDVAPDYSRVDPPF
ncbi:single-stranded DNA-binding protein [Actinomycetaceae bacterium MB13-C1-2]|nr:single-stranded DNA-binding protein [Actinomycetaceae bacterium MB13-C1-2]